ncbi:MAG: nicotinamide mononucleotide transporter [Chlorobi bacterium]|nr:nicotinamide mononucleotide transporter [Chlorobiota bacterium]
MDQIIDFFIDPYRGTPAIYIILEFTAAFLGILSVYYARKENILVYPTGILSTGLYVYLLSRWQLYGDLIINIYYTLMSLYGWYMWSKPIDAQKHHRPITRTTPREWLVALGIFIFTSAFVIAVYRYYEVMPRLGLRESWEYFWSHFRTGRLEDLKKITPYLDTFTTGAAFAAMLLMAWKKWENWHLWISLNIVSIPLYFIKGYGFTGIQYTIFLILAFQGLREWKKKLQTASAKPANP